LEFSVKIFSKICIKAENLSISQLAYYDYDDDVPNHYPILHGDDDIPNLPHHDDGGVPIHCPILHYDDCDDVPILHDDGFDDDFQTFCLRCIE